MVQLLENLPSPQVSRTVHHQDGDPPVIRLCEHALPAFQQPIALTIASNPDGDQRIAFGMFLVRIQGCERQNRFPPQLFLRSANQKPLDTLLHKTKAMYVSHGKLMKANALIRGPPSRKKAAQIAINR